MLFYSHFFLYKKMADQPEPAQPDKVPRQTKNPLTAARPTNLKETGKQWTDANAAYLHGEKDSSVVLQDEEEKLEASSWEDVTFDNVKQEIAQMLLQREGNSQISEELRGTANNEVSQDRQTERLSLHWGGKCRPVWRRDYE